MSGSSVVRDGSTLVNSYGPELDTLREGECLGVMRTHKASNKTKHVLCLTRIST